MRLSCMNIALYSLVVSGFPLASPEDEAVAAEFVDRHGIGGRLRPKAPGLLSGRLGNSPSPKSEGGLGSILGK